MHVCVVYMCLNKRKIINMDYFKRYLSRYLYWKYINPKRHITDYYELKTQKNMQIFYIYIFLTLLISFDKLFFSIGEI